jgi:hypothetical protein
MFGKRLKDGDRRSAPRKRSPLNGTITYGTGNSIRCSVIDISGSGALLQLTSILGVPNQFRLQEGRGPTRSVEVVRRGPSRLGVRFI